MNLKDQVCSLELAIKLKDFGVEQSSLFYWVKRNSTWRIEMAEADHEVQALRADNEEVYSAFTVGELGGVLPKEFYYSIGIALDGDHFMMCYSDPQREEKLKMLIRSREVTVRAEMLIYLLENELISL
jgi:hypothetical protein